MANLIIQAVQISLGQEFAEDATLGLYTVAGTSYLRWSEAPLAGVAETWASDILLKNGISETVESSNLSRGGNIAEYSGLTVRATNAEDLKVYLDDLGVNLIGLSATMIEFEGTSTDSDSAARTTRFTGVVEDIKCGDTTLTILLKNSLYKRETNIGTVTSEGVEVPVTFGKHTPPLKKVVDGVETDTTEIRNLAKFVRTDDTYDEETYKESFFTGTSSDIKIFPIIAISTGETTFRVATNNSINFSSIIPEDIYVIISDGDGKGQIRLVESITSTVSANAFSFTVKDVFYDDLSISGDTRSWVKFVKRVRKHKADIWPCKDFLKSEDGIGTDQKELFTYDEDLNKFSAIPSFGFEITDTANNTINLDGQQSTTDIDAIESYTIKTVPSVYASTDADLSRWNYDTEIYFGSFTKFADGLYGDDIGSCSGTFFDPEYSYDRISTSYSTFDCTFISAGALLIGKLIKVINFTIPKQPDMEWDDLIIGVKLNTHSASAVGFSGGSSFRIMLDTFGNYKRYTILNDKKLKETLAGGSDVSCIPDRYWTDSVSTSNHDYFKKSTESGGFYDDLTGYEYFKVSGITKENYEVLTLGCLFFYRENGFTVGTDDLKLYDISFIFKKSSTSIKKEIYSPLSGRIINSGWEGRKTFSNLIENPKDVIEHCKRLQNWSETSPNVYNWGKEYAESEIASYDKIKISGEGSFDSTNLDYLATEKICLQITDKDKQTTTAITKKLCDTAHVCSYIDSDGYECLETLEPTNPSETINLDDVIGSIGDVIEPQIENIYCEPVINYLYNQGSQKFDRTMSVTNIGESAWQSSYTPGYLDADGQIIWNTCKALYQKYRQIERCPDDFSNHPELADYQTVVNYVKRKLAWMDKKRLPTITIAYSKGKDYTIFKHLLVQLPTHTRNSVIECIIEKIVKDKNSGIVKIDCVILGNMETAWYDTSDSLNEKVDTADNGNEAIIDV